MIIGRLNPTNSTINANINKGEFVKFLWTNNHSNAEAVFNNFTTLASVSITEDSSPTCTVDGKLTYTATYGEYKDSYTYITPAIGHEWIFKGFSWEGTSVAYGEFECVHNSLHRHRVKADIQEFLLPHRYVATFMFGGQTYTDTLISPTLEDNNVILK